MQPGAGGRAAPSLDVFRGGPTPGLGTAGDTLGTALGRLRQHPEPPDLAHPPHNGPEQQSVLRDLGLSDSQQPRTPKLAGDPQYQPGPHCCPRMSKTSQGPQHWLGTSNKIWGPLILAKMPNTGWGPQCWMGPQCHLGTPPMLTGPPPVLSGDSQHHPGPQTSAGTSILSGTPTPAGDPRGGHDPAGVLGRGQVPPGWPYPAAVEDAGVGAVRPALTMSNEGSSSLAVLPERLLNGGKKGNQ